MKKFLLLFYSLLFSAYGFGQNLVPNPSFEIFDTCPNLAQINYAIGWSSYSYTPDYYNACVTPDTFGRGCSMPINFGGYQNARTGNGYTALATFAVFGVDAREYIGIQLVQPLVVGVKYYGSFYVSKTDCQICGIATNKIGMKLSTIPYSYTQNNNQPVNNIAHIYSDSIISDTLNWVRIFGSFVADSAYSFLSIGNFFKDSLTSRIVSDTSARYGYYYIEDITLSIDSTISISEIPNHNSEIKIFPNPTRGEFVVSSSEFVDKELTIYNTLGEIIHRQIITSAHQQINLRAGAGVYILKVASSPSTGSGTSATGAVQRLIIY
jgi:hypothetical protein